MKLTNGDLFTASGPLKTLIAMKFPVAVSFKLAKMANKLNDSLKSIEDVRNGLINKYGEQNEKGQTAVSEDSPNFAKFVSEFNDLMAIEVEVVIEKVKLPEEVDGRPLEIEPSLLMALEKFVDV